MRVLVMHHASIGLDAVGALDTLWADACKEIQHAMEVHQVVKVRINLRDEA